MQKKRWGCFLRAQDGWASLIGLLIAAAIAFFLYAAYVNFGQNERPQMKEVQDSLQAGGFSGGVSSEPSGTGSLGVLKSATRQIQAIDERNRQRGDDLMKEIGAMQGN